MNLRWGAGLHGEGGHTLFVLDVEHPHEGGRVTNVLVGFLLLFFEHVENPVVALDAVVARVGSQVHDLGVLGLAVAVDAPVALLKNHQRPWNIKVNHPVRQIMKVYTFRRYI